MRDRETELRVKGVRLSCLGMSYVEPLISGVLRERVLFGVDNVEVRVGACRVVRARWNKPTEYETVDRDELNVSEW